MATKLMVIDERGDVDTTGYREWSHANDMKRERRLGIPVQQQTSFLSISGCADLRTYPNEAELVLQQLREAATRKLRQWKRAAAGHQARPGQGGSVIYRPLAIVLSNYGGCLLADRTGLVTHFCTLEGCKRPYYLD